MIWWKRALRVPIAGWILFAFFFASGASAARAQEPAGVAAPFPPDRMVAHYIDVDQGSATLLEFSCGAVLIDAGGYGTPAREHLVEYLEAFFERRTDLNRTLAAVFVTHRHSDHDAHLARLFGYTIGGFVYNGATDARIRAMLRHARGASPRIPEAAITDAEIEAARMSGVTNSVIDPVNCTGVDPVIRVLSGGQSDNPGWRRAEFRKPNNHSLVIRVDFDDASFLFTGDLETPAIESLLATYRGTTALNIDVYAVGHHGADNGTTIEMLRAMTPEIAVIPVGRPSTTRGRTAFGYGHPRKVTLELLEGAIARSREAPVEIMTSEAGNGAFTAFLVRDAIYASSRDGDIRITAFGNGTLQVHTSR